MGRDIGHIALNAGVESAEEILVPEEDLGLDRLLESLEKVKVLVSHLLLLLLQGEIKQVKMFLN